MTFTYDLADTIGEVRFELTDTTEEFALFSDEEITHILNDNAGNVLATAAHLCDILATRFAGDYDFSEDGQSFKRSQAATNWAARANALRARATGAGGLSTVATVRDDAYSHDLTGRGTATRDGTGRIPRDWQPADLPD